MFTAWTSHPRPARTRGRVYLRLVLREFEEDAHPRDDKGKFSPDSGARNPKPSAKALLAKQTSRRVNAEVQRYSEEGAEPQLATGLGGVSLRDNEPIDVLVVREGVVKAGVELKTMTDNKNGRIFMKPSAQARKQEWTKTNKAHFHTVVFDDQKVFNAKGKGKHDTSKRQIYYRRGYGNMNVSAMHPVKDMAELNKLIHAKTADLPDAARPQSQYRAPRGVKGFDPDQPREPDGRFGSGGDGSKPQVVSTEEYASAHSKFMSSVVGVERNALSAFTGNASKLLRAREAGTALNFKPHADDYEDGDVESLDNDIRVLNTLVARAPEYQGTAYRGLIRATPEQHAALTATGSVFTTEAMSSFTSDPGVANKYTGKYQLIVKGKTGGIELKHLSKHPSEKEVLVPRGTRYKITQVEKPKNDGDAYRIHLEKEES